MKKNGTLSQPDYRSPMFISNILADNNGLSQARTLHGHCNSHGHKNFDKFEFIRIFVCSMELWPQPYAGKRQ